MHTGIVDRRQSRLILAVSALLGGVTAMEAGIALDNRVVTTPRHTITIDAIGLPAQLAIRPAAGELPLPLRTADTVSDQDLRALGRGSQFAAPMRIEVTIEGTVIQAEPVAPAVLEATPDGVTATADWTADGLRGRLQVGYGADGSLDGSLTYGGQERLIERLDLVLRLDGRVDTVVAGMPLAVEGGLPPDYGALDAGPGVVWRNGAAPVGTGAAADRVSHFFLGSGDRGFTWLAEPDGEGFVLDAAAPSVSIERDEGQTVIWRLALLNTPTPVGADRTARFALLVHPARTRADGRRGMQWRPWPDAPATPALTWAARGAVNGLVRADAASVHEGSAASALLTGPAGGDAHSPEATLADTVPLGLFRYLSAHHTALTVQLRPNARTLAAPGDSPANDRMALGRALLHDIGVDLAGLGQRVAAAGVVRALEEFGLFADDGQTEFLPYWRTDGMLRYGEAFAAERGFEVTEEAPAARVRVSVFLRPSAADPERRQALFVIVNEGPRAVREQFYIQQPERLFGGPNRVTAAAIYNRMDFSRIPEDSDWRRQIIVANATRYSGRVDDGLASPHAAPQLMDLEAGGFVRSVSRRDGIEVYGRLHVPARGMRLLYGAGAF